MHKTRFFTDPFTDLLFNALLGFTFLFMVAILFIVFDLEATDLVGLDFAGTGDVVVSALTVEDLAVTARGVGAVEFLQLDAFDVRVELVGVGDVEMAGTVDTQVATVTGLGHYAAGNFQSREARLTMGRNGEATVRVSELLVVEFTNGGSVKYHGDPRLQVTGSGELQQLE